MNGLSGHPGHAIMLLPIRHIRRRHKTMTLIQAPTTTTVMTRVMMVIVLHLTRLTIVIHARGADWYWASGKLLIRRLAIISTAVDSVKSQRRQRLQSSSMQRSARWEIAQVWCAARGFAEPMVEASDVNIPRVATRVRSVQPHSAKPTAGASCASIWTVVTRMLGVQPHSAQPMAEASYVNIRTVVARVPRVQPHFA
jgi:hypothetical protein